MSKYKGLGKEKHPRAEIVYASRAIADRRTGTRYCKDQENDGIVIMPVPVLIQNARLLGNTYYSALNAIW